MDIYQIVQIIKKRILLIAIIPILIIFISGIVNYCFLTPEYKAKATLIVGKNTEAEAQKMQYNDVSMYQKLVKTYVEIAKSRKVSEETISNLKLNISPEGLQSKLSISPAADTEVLYISYEDEDPIVSASVANELSGVFIKRAKELMTGESIQIIDEAKAPRYPFNPNPFKNMTIAFFLGLMLAGFLIFILEYMDMTIKSVDAIENNLDIPVVGVIPYSKTV